MTPSAVGDLQMFPMQTNRIRTPVRVRRNVRERRLFCPGMRRTALLAGLVLGLALIPATVADARVAIRVGIGDQQVGMFDQPAFQRAKFKRVRYFIPWNAMDNPAQLAAARRLRAAAPAPRACRCSSTSPATTCASRRARLPSVDAYRSQMARLVPHFRALGVREFGTWNEANHASQPTYRSPTRAASFFKVMYRQVKDRCRSCTVVALDVLDQPGVDRYMRSFYRALSSTYRRRASARRHPQLRRRQPPAHDLHADDHPPVTRPTTAARSSGSRRPAAS